MLSVLSGGDTKSAKSESPSATSSRKRAPRGLPRKLVSRVLYDNDAFGSTPQDIVDSAVSEDEKMIAISTVRSELRKGEDEGIYQSSDGDWRLTPASYLAFEKTGKADLPRDGNVSKEDNSAPGDPGWKRLMD
jgi:hypothetical protein